MNVLLLCECLLSPTGHIAVGCGDHLIRIWNVENSRNPCDAQVYWQGLKSKVTSVCISGHWSLCVYLFRIRNCLNGKRIYIMPKL